MSFVLQPAFQTWMIKIKTQPGYIQKHVQVVILCEKRAGLCSADWTDPE